MKNACDLKSLTPLALVVLLGAAAPAAARQAAPQDPAAAQGQPATSGDKAVDPAQPDFTVIALPTTLRMPKFRGSFRLTHRFTRPIDQGNFGDFVDDFFGFDSSAQVGLEFRFGIWDKTQVGIYRTSDRTIQFFAQREVIRQGKFPVTVDGLAAIEGTNNIRDNHQPA